MLKDAISRIDLSAQSDEFLRLLFLKIGREMEIRGRIERQEALALKRVQHGAHRTHNILSSRPVHASFEELDKEDWSDLFPVGDTARKYYVYAHMTTGRSYSKHESYPLPFGLTKLPFYIGKGTGNRAWDFNRNQGHGAILKQYTSTNRSTDSVVKILRSDLTENEALSLESKVIYFFGTRYEIGRKGVLVNLDVPARPDWCVATRFSKKVSLAQQ